MPSIRRRPRDFSLKALEYYQRDEELKLTKKDCALIQAHLRDSIDLETRKEDRAREVEESLHALLEDNVRFLSYFYWLTLEDLPKFAQRRRALYKKAIEEEWAVQVMLSMRDRGEPLDLVNPAEC